MVIIPAMQRPTFGGSQTRNVAAIRELAAQDWTALEGRFVSFAELAMSTNKWGWKPREVARAIGVVRKATGLAVTAVTISTKGDITVATGAQADGGNAPNPWEQTVADLETDRSANNSKSSKAKPARSR